MKKRINVENLQPGTIAKQNLYSKRDELLIGEGTIITEKHLAVLNKRNIFELYIQSSKDDEIMEIIAKEFTQLEDLDLEFGKKGFEKLTDSKISIKIDKKLAEKSSVPDTPSGMPLKVGITQLKPGERSKEYLNDISLAYKNAREKTRYVLDALVKGNTNCSSEISNIIKQFTNIFLTDKNILLNISGTNPDSDEYLYHHSLNVCILSINIAASYGYNKKQVLEIGVGALLHDIGMLLIPNEIRYKHDRFSKEDFYEVQKHPILGLHLLEKVRGLPESTMYISYQVHERENSTGYPKQRGSHLIHRYAKLVQVADVYEALSSPRPHRPAYLPYQAAETLIKMAKAGLIASDFVKAFLTYMSLYPIGSLVLLSNQCLAKVVDTNKIASDKPVVSVLTDSNGSFLPKQSIYQLDLLQNEDLQIEQALSFSNYKNISIMDGF